MATRTVRHPDWVREAVRGRLRNLDDQRRGRRRPFDLWEHAEHVRTVDETLQVALGVSADEVAAVRARVRLPDEPPGTWGGGSDLLALVGSLVLLRRPERVLETGVAAGYTTAVILAALESNQAGVLHSIDLPPLQVEADRFVGRVVPDDLRHRWTLHAGPTRTLLGGVARGLAPLDLFIHDSDHSYAGQLEDYYRAWPHLAGDGCFVSDDVRNPAFVEFAREVGAEPYLIAPPGQPAAVGLIVERR